MTTMESAPCTSGPRCRRRDAVAAHTSRHRAHRRHTACSLQTPLPDKLRRSRANGATTLRAVSLLGDISFRSQWAWYTGKEQRAKGKEQTGKSPGPDFILLTLDF